MHLYEKFKTKKIEIEVMVTFNVASLFTPIPKTPKEAILNKPHTKTRTESLLQT